MIEARRKQLLRDLSMLQMGNLAYSKGDPAQRVYNDMLNEFYSLEGIDRKGEEIEANWQSIRLIGRG